MHLDDLGTLILLAESGSFRAAAARTGQSRAALRRRLERLEREVGTQLVTRTETGLLLTGVGERFLARARVLQDEVRQAVAEAQSIQPAAQGEIRLVVGVGLPPALRAQGVQLLTAAAPELTLRERVVERPQDVPVSDFELMLCVEPGRLSDDLVARTLRQTPVRLVASPDYLRRAGRPTSLDQLQDHPLLLWRHPALPALALPLRDGGRHRAHPRLETNDLGLLAACVAAGQGVALMPFEAAISPGLTPLLEDRVGCTLRAVLISRQPSRLAPPVRALVENMHALLDQL